LHWPSKTNGKKKRIAAAEAAFPAMARDPSLKRARIMFRLQGIA